MWALGYHRTESHRTWTLLLAWWSVYKSIQCHRLITRPRRWEKVKKESSGLRNRSSLHCRHLIMGCYGIGVTRLMAAVVEILTPNDSSTLRWPRRITPYQVAILPPKVRSDADRSDVADVLVLSSKEARKKRKATIKLLGGCWNWISQIGLSMIEVNSRLVIG